MTGLRCATETLVLLLRVDAVVSAADLRLIAAADRRRQEIDSSDTQPVCEVGGGGGLSLTQHCIQEAKGYRRPRRRVDAGAGWTAEERRKHARSERLFYSREQQDRRARLEARSLRMPPGRTQPE
jgi:hypothetical protein